MGIEEQIKQHIQSIDILLDGRGADDRAVVMMQAKSTALLALATIGNAACDGPDVPLNIAVGMVKRYEVPCM